MPEIDPVILQLKADVARYNAEMQQTARRVTASLDMQESSIVRLENRMGGGFDSIGRSSTRASSLVSTAMGTIKGALAGVASVALIGKFLQIADEAKQLDAQLRLATSGFGSLAQAQDDVARIADATRSGLSETASLYGNFVRGAKELGGTQAEAARATETFSKTLKISGADANQAASATLQFGQALAAGALRGDELNSILEASPRLARLLAEAMGQPIGQIKKLGEEGKLTSDKLLDALTNQKFTAGIDAEFNQLPVTFEQALTRIYNAALTTFSAFDQGGQFSSSLAAFFNQGADGFAGMEESAFSAGAEIRATFEGLTDVFDPLIQAAFGAFDQIESRANYARDTIANILRAYDNVDNFFKGVDNFGRRVDNSIKRTINTAQRRAGAGPNAAYFKETPLVAKTDTAAQFLKAFNASAARSQGERQQSRFDAQMSRYDVMGNLRAGNPGSAPGPKPSPAPTSGGKKTQEPKSKLSPEAFAREEASLNDQILRIKASEVVGLNARATAEAARIEAAKAAAQAEIDASEKYTPEQKKRLKALTETVASLQTAAVITERDTEMARQVEEARRGSYRYERDALEATAQAADTRLQRLDAERRILASMEREERERLEAEIAAGKIADAAKARADLATAQAARRGATERDLESPLQRAQRDIANQGNNLNDQFETVAVNGLDRLNDGLTDAIMNAKGFGDAFKNVAKQVIADLIRIAIRQTIVNSLMGSIGGLFGGGAPGANVGVGFASGGYTGDGPRNQVAGVVHKGEYVVPARAVDRIGVQSLAALTAGDTSAARAMTGVVAAAPASVQQTGVIRVALMMDNDVFTARVQEASVPVAVEVYKANAPGMVAAAKAETMRDLGRPRI